jgi:heme exporter protein D
MTGTIVGGWEFVWAAYGLTSAVLLIYGVYVVTRIRKERQHEQRH